MANVSLEADFTFKQSVANKLKTDGLGNPYLSPLNEKIYIKEAYDHSAIWMDTVGVTLGKNGGGTFAYQEFHALYDVNRVTGVSDTPAYYGWTWRTSVFDWITPEYHPDYEIQVFHAPAGTTYASTLDHVDNTSTPYVIDYITGALTFIASVPSYLTSGGHILYMQGYTYTGRKGLASVAHTGSYLDLQDKPNIVIDYNNLLHKPSLCNVAFTGLATDITFPAENAAPLIFYTNIIFLLPSIDVMQADWNTTDYTAVSYIKNKPLISFDTDNNMLFLGKVQTTGNITGSSVGVGTTAPTSTLDVRGDAKISGTLYTSNLQVLGTNTVINGLETVSSNVSINNTSGFGPALKVRQTGVGANYPIADFYDNDVSTTVPALRIADGGYVGVGIASPLTPLHVYGATTHNGNVGVNKPPSTTFSLDVSGSVNVSGGTITTGNSCSLCYWKLTGTTPTYSASVAVDLNIQFPLGCDATTVVAIFGTFVNGTTRMPFNMSTGGTSWTTQLYNDSTQVKMSLVAGAASASARPYSIIIITSS